jgi:hypothetical protein
MNRAVNALACIVYPYRRQASWLAFAGAALAGATAPLAAIRLSPPTGLPYVVVSTAEIALAVGCRRASRVALAVTGAVMAGQVFGVVGSAWALIVNPEGAKADELRSLGVNPRLGFAANLLYSALAVALLVVMLLRARARPDELPAR